MEKYRDNNKLDLNENPDESNNLDSKITTIDLDEKTE